MNKISFILQTLKNLLFALIFFNSLKDEEGEKKTSKEYKEIFKKGESKNPESSFGFKRKRKIDSRALPKNRERIWIASKFGEQEPII